MRAATSSLALGHHLRRWHRRGVVAERDRVVGRVDHHDVGAGDRLEHLRWRRISRAFGGAGAVDRRVAVVLASARP